MRCWVRCWVQCWVRGGVEDPQRVFKLTEALIDSSTGQGEATHLIEGLLGYPGTAPDAEVWLRDRWGQWPSHARAARGRRGASRW